MDSQFNFNDFSRQSKKGIFVIYLNLLYKTLRTFWILLFLFIKDFSKFSNVSLNYIYLGFSILLLFFLVRAVLIYKNFQFKIINDEFVLHQGILKKTKTAISFDRIQNINFKQNIIQQIINVYQVDIETAGSSETEISIKALSLKEAQALKKQILLKRNAKINNENETFRKPFLKISVSNLLKVSITENHLQSLFIFGSLLLALYIQIEDIFRSLGSEDSIDNYIDVNSFQVSIILFLILAVFVVFLGIFVSFIRVFLNHFGLTVFVKNKTFEITQGLFTKKSILLRKKKIQSITISTNPIKKKLGISFITFKQAVSGKLNAKKNKLIRIVGCKDEQISKIKKIIFDTNNLNSLEKKHSDIYMKKRMFFWGFSLLLIINIVLFLIFDSYKISLINILLIPFSVLWIIVKYKKTFYKIDNELLLIGNGVFETHLTYFQMYKVQTVQLKQSYFQARKNIADLVFQTASGKIKIPCIKKQTALKIYNYILFKAETSTKSWM